MWTYILSFLRPLTCVHMVSAVMAHQALNQQQQLLGQPQVAPQFILAGNAIQSSQSSAAAAAATLPVQQLLIPVSTGTGAQQLLTLPISLAASANSNQIQLLTTSNGQLLAANLANLAQPLNVNVSPNAGKGREWQLE